jgi:chorismate mutase
MAVKGIRGAITIEHNSKENIKQGVIELLTEITKKNNLTPENISHAIFTTTKDINSETITRTYALYFPIYPPLFI